MISQHKHVKTFTKIVFFSPKEYRGVVFTSIFENFTEKLHIVDKSFNNIMQRLNEENER